MDDQYLTGPPGRRSRSSHNTFLSLLVEQGLPGAIMYVIFVLWGIKKVFSVARLCRRAGGEVATFFPAVAAGLLVTFIGDLFVDYLKLEVRIWFIALLLILERMALAHEAAAKAAAHSSTEQPLRRPGTQSPVAR